MWKATQFAFQPTSVVLVTWKAVHFAFQPTSVVLVMWKAIQFAFQTTSVILVWKVIQFAFQPNWCQRVTSRASGRSIPLSKIYGRI